MVFRVCAESVQAEMAQRRMFSKSIINSARFLKMPLSTRLLYYELGMAADDDGIVEAFAVLRITGTSEDDLRVLEARGFIVILNEDLLSYIVDWTVNNQIRKDRYTPSIYRNLIPGYTYVDSDVSGGLPDGNHDGNQLETQYSIGQFSLDQYSVVQSNTGKNSTENNSGVDDVSKSDFDLFWKAYPKKVGKKDALKAFRKIRGVGIEVIIQALEKLCYSDQWTKENGKYIPYPATWLNRGGWDDELDNNDLDERNRERTEERRREELAFSYTGRDCVEYPPGSGVYISRKEWEVINHDE